MSRNNFSRPENRSRARYRLWVLFYPNRKKHDYKRKKVYYSYNHKNKEDDYGLKKLKELALKRLPEIEIAILYDNVTNLEIIRYRNK